MYFKISYSTTLTNKKRKISNKYPKAVRGSFLVDN